ncbi:hypothetical protein DYQ86_01280 [Acidobacteria bacterium AB60]|nr:hypothetical protein DYQ86_01280 [Acidobacteria bacterium AB60]
MRALTLLLSVLATSPAIWQAAPPKPPALPTPAGPYGIGRAGYEWTDTSRPDRYASTPNAPRRLMVHVWYPTQRNQLATGAYLPGAQQLDADSAAQRSMRDDHGANWPLIVSGAIHSHAIENAPIARQPAKFPVIVLSHGLGGSGFGYTALNEYLVSRGYVVAAIEHTYTAGAVLFPDGNIVLQHQDQPPPGLSPEERFKRMAASVTETITEGAADVRFVYDRLVALDSDSRSPLAGHLDLHHVAAMGHSAGAEFAARACQLDARFQACVDLDGGMVPVAALPDYSDGATMKQPLLFLEAVNPKERMFGSPDQIAGYLKKKDQQLQTCCPPGSYAVELHSPGITHGSFSDDPLLGAGDSVSSQNARHNLDLIESVIGDFLDITLKGGKSTLLDSPAPQSPEIAIRNLGH